MTQHEAELAVSKKWGGNTYAKSMGKPDEGQGEKFTVGVIFVSVGIGNLFYGVGDSYEAAIIDCERKIKGGLQREGAA